MATRPTGVKYWKGNSAGGTVMTGMGNLYSVFLNWTAMTDKDRVLIYDGTTAMLEVSINNVDSDGISIDLPSVGLQFATSLRVVCVLAAGGELNITIGYDGNG
jgi:hypothetical protein